jgi:hypothetical protein
MGRPEPNEQNEESREPQVPRFLDVLLRRASSEQPSAPKCSPLMQMELAQ